MKRITAKSLRFDLNTLNMLLERPVEQFASKVGEPVKFNIGHLYLDHNAQGYSIEEQTSEGGGVHDMTGRLSASEMHIMIRGMMKGVGLRNAHIGELFLRNEMLEAGLDSPLYKQDAEQLRNYVASR
jgi:hypothetical protein